MVLYIYDGTFTGFLTVVFSIYASKQLPSGILANGEYQTTFFSKTVFVPSDEDRAERVERRIISKAGFSEFSRILSAFSCGFALETKDMIIFSYIRLLLKEGSSACKMHNLKIVSEFDNLVLKTDFEIHRMEGFLRFRKLNSGILYAEYAPDNDITYYLTPYFAERNSENKFIIRDTARETYGLYNGTEWVVIRGKDDRIDLFSEPIFEECELFFQDLWQQYYDTVSIASRRNERQRDHFLPVRYRRYLTETVI